MTTAAQSALFEVKAALDAHEYERAIEVLTTAGPSLRVDDETEFRALLDEGWGRMSIGEVDEAVAKLDRARTLSEREGFNDLDRAEVLFRLGCCRLKLGVVTNAVQLLTLALDLGERSGLLSDPLRIDILLWRTRCYRRQRDWPAARADGDAAIELAERDGVGAQLADAYLQASQVAERTGQLMIARFYVERAVDLFRDAGDLLSAGKALNNLGGILFLLGRADDAKAQLAEAFTVALQLDNDVDAGYAVSSTAQVLLRCAEPEAAEHNARHALTLLADRRDHVNEIGSARLVLGRALMEQSRFDEADEALAAADANFEQLGSIGHRAAAWLAQGDLAARRGLIDEAAAVYRRAAEALQDVRF
jgi:tetratricopeptide (TPR) repeat protein